MTFVAGRAVCSGFIRDFYLKTASVNQNSNVSCLTTKDNELKLLKCYNSHSQFVVFPALCVVQSVQAGRG